MIFLFVLYLTALFLQGFAAKVCTFFGIAKLFNKKDMYFFWYCYNYLKTSYL